MAGQDDMTVPGTKGLSTVPVEPIAYIATQRAQQVTLSPNEISNATQGLRWTQDSESNIVGLNPFQFGTGFIGGNYAFNDKGEYVPVARGEVLKLIG